LQVRIPTNILADRLKRLEEAGLVRKEPYQDHLDIRLRCLVPVRLGKSDRSPDAFHKCEAHHTCCARLKAMQERRAKNVQKHANPVQASRNRVP